MIRTIREVENLDSFDKLRIYIKYRCTMLASKLDFHARYEGDVLVKMYLWEDTVIKSFSEFCSRSNIKVVRHQESNPYSGRMYLKVDYCSIYHYGVESLNFRLIE